MRKLNAAVDKDKRRPEAREFLLRLDNREARAYTPTSTGRIRRSSAGTGSP
jgi:hypothetical protein